MDQDKFETKDGELDTLPIAEEPPIPTETADAELEGAADAEEMSEVSEESHEESPEQAPEEALPETAPILNEGPVGKGTPRKPEPMVRRVDGRYDFVELFVFTLVAVLVITTFFFRHSVVDGDSMEKTLLNGEHLVLSSFLYTPKQGDIIVCEDYSTGLKKPIVKRVIATEGQRVDILSASEVYVDGVLLDESSYVYIDGFDQYYFDKYPLSFKVSEGHLFVLGDHRNASSDSRDFGEISEKSVLGKVVLRIYPFEKFGAVD